MMMMMGGVVVVVVVMVCADSIISSGVNIHLKKLVREILIILFFNITKFNITN